MLYFYILERHILISKNIVNLLCTELYKIFFTSFEVPDRLRTNCVLIKSDCLVTFEELEYDLCQAR